MMITTVTTTMKTINEDNTEATNCEDNDDLIFLHNKQPVLRFIPGRKGVVFDVI